MLDAILEAIGLEPERCAGLLGVSPRLFGEWLAAQRSMPASYANLLGDILGVQPSILQAATKQDRMRDVRDFTPAIWYKFRGEGLVDADREYVLLIRHLGRLQNQLENVTGKRAVGWKPLFDAIRREVNGQAPPSEQGRMAAQIFRESTGLSQCATGIGEVFRGNLRRLGIIVTESPIPESRIEGCSFYVGTHPSERPAIFANTHHSTWFRRNVILMHEVGHAVFDVPSVAASLDFSGTDELTEISEKRAQAFAQEALIPRSVLRHIAQGNGIKWTALTAEDLSVLVALTHVEQKMVVQASVNAGFVGIDEKQRLLALDISKIVPFIPIAIDIKPGGADNPINPNSQGKIPVAILSSPTVDARSQVYVNSLTFGRTGAESSLAFCDSEGEDVNGDGLPDLVCHFYTQETGFQAGDTHGVLKGLTGDGELIRGTDSVQIVP